MEVKLIIKSTREEDKVNVLGKEYSFVDASQIAIGRGKPNDIPLFDSDRTISRNHALLVEAEKGYVLKDLGSKNFSYVNEEKISLESSMLLTSGDIIRIGEFEFEYHLSETQADLDLTVIDPIGAVNFNEDNPFDDAVQELVRSWKELETTYDQNRLSTKMDYLSQALKKEIPAIEGHPLMNVFLSLVSAEDTSNPTHLITRSAGETVSTSEPSTNVAQSSSQNATVKAEWTDLVLDSTLMMLKELIRIPYEFRGEFIGHTMWQDEESTFFYEGDYSVTKNYLLSDANESEVRRKLERLKDVSDKVKLHQVGMMEGYKAIVKEGLNQLMKEIDPGLIELELQKEETGFLNKVLPSLAAQKILKTIEERIGSVRETDWGVHEQRIYRPVFIRAYMMSTGKDD